MMSLFSSKMYSHVKYAEFSLSPSILGMTGFERNCLDSHNEYRKKHGVPPLQWSAALAKDAQDWANEIAKRDSPDHDETARSNNQVHFFV